MGQSKDIRTNGKYTSEERTSGGVRTSDDIRRQVSEAYTRAVGRPGEGGCCGPSCCSDSGGKGVVVESAGYEATSLEALPEDAVENAFGCGNPVAFSVLNLSPDKPRVFAEIARVLAPGGRIHISDLVAESLPDWVRADADLYSSC